MINYKRFKEKFPTPEDLEKAYPVGKDVAWLGYEKFTTVVAYIHDAYTTFEYAAKPHKLPELVCTDVHLVVIKTWIPSKVGWSYSVVDAFTFYSTVEMIEREMAIEAKKSKITGPKLNDCSYPYDDNTNIIVSHDGSLKMLYHTFSQNDTDATYPFKWDTLLLESVKYPKNFDKNPYIDIYGYGIDDWDWQKPFSVRLFDGDSALMIFKGCTVVNAVTGEKGTAPSAQRLDKVTIQVAEMEVF